MPNIGAGRLYKQLYIDPEILDRNFNIVGKNKKNNFYELKEFINEKYPIASDLLFMEFPYSEYGIRSTRFTIIDRILAGEAAVNTLLNHEWKSVPKKSKPSKNPDKVIDVRGYIISNGITSKEKYLHWFILNRNNQPFANGWVVHHRKQRFDNRMISMCRIEKKVHDAIVDEDEKEDLLVISTESGMDLDYLFSIL